MGGAPRPAGWGGGVRPVCDPMFSILLRPHDEQDGHPLGTVGQSRGDQVRFGRQQPLPNVSYPKNSFQVRGFFRALFRLERTTTRREFELGHFQT